MFALIEAWKEEELLFNPKHPLYYNKNARMEALERIASFVVPIMPEITTGEIRVSL